MFEVLRDNYRRPYITFHVELP